jgi:hypothetical protein
MRKLLAVSLVAMSLVGMGASLAVAPARADWISAVKGNDTGGIIAYTVAQVSDARQIAVNHCAKYGKVAKFLAIDPQPGGYVSFSCRWVPYGANDRPLSVNY